jgi:hypothetical protein
MEIVIIETMLIGGIYSYFGFNIDNNSDLINIKKLIFVISKSIN